MIFQTFRAADTTDHCQKVIDLSSGQSLLTGLLQDDCSEQRQMEVSILHLVLPPLAVPIVPGGNAGDLGDHIIDSIWQVFSSVREWHNKLRDQKTAPTVLIWAWPGESSDRPPTPMSAASLTGQSDASLSLLPAVSALLRCMALELDRSIMLITTDAKPQPDEVRDATFFLAEQAVQIGDVSLSNHCLSSFEPRLVSVNQAKNGGENIQLLEGHILSLGGARGIVAEMLNRLTSSQSHLSLVGRTKPERPDPDFVGLPKQELMRLLMDRSREIGGADAITPKSLQRQVDEIQRQVALESQLKRLRNELQRFDYHAVDLSNPVGFKALIDQDLMDGPSRPVAPKVGFDAPLIQISCNFALTFPVMDKSAIYFANQLHLFNRPQSEDHTVSLNAFVLTAL